MQRFDVLSPLLAPLVRLVVSLFWRLGPGLAAFLPQRLRTLLATGTVRETLIQIIVEIAADPTLSNPARRERALRLLAAWLKKQGVDLTDQELALLVELVYGWVKRHRRSAIAPPPMPFREA